MYQQFFPRIIVASLCLVALVSLGCDEDPLDDPLAQLATDNGPDEGVMPVSAETGLGGLSSAAAETDASAAGPAGDEPARESVEIKPYTGPPIYLDESEPPPPATVVERSRTVTSNFAEGGVHIERQVTRFSDDRLVNDGTYREYFPNGQLFVEGTYEEGEQEGQWNYYHDNGQLNRTVTYKNGLPHGSWDVLRADGTVEAKRGFENGQRHGEWVEYDDSGKQPLQMVNYEKGKLHGELKQWFPSGQQKFVRQYEHGLLAGMSTEWNEEGKKTVEADFQNGKFHGTVRRWDADGNVFVQQFEEGRLVSQVKE